MEINQLQVALDEVEAVKSQVHIVAQDINNEKREAFQVWIYNYALVRKIKRLVILKAADVLAEWEEKVKVCKKTQHLISHEKDPSGELAHLKAEVHRLQVGNKN